MDAIYYAYFFLYGAILGSFAYVVIERTLAGERLSGRSHCFSCRKQLPFYDLIPVLSWLCLKGRCRYCHAQIPFSYPFSELLCGILFCLCYARFGLSLKTFMLCLMAFILFIISVIDAKTLLVSDYFLLMLALISVIWFFSGKQTFCNAFLGFLSALPLWLLVYFGGLGSGDALLMMISGLILGLPANILAFFLGCCCASFINVIGLLRHKTRQKEIAFIPYLSIGIFIAALWGDTLISWYINRF